MGKTIPADLLERALEDKVAGLANRFRVPGVAAGILLQGRRFYAYHGVTSTANPLPVDGRTLFQVGSNTKTFTATLLCLLQERGKVGLDDRVARYVPELKLRDRAVRREVTVRHLLNHTAGWYGDLFADTGQGDDALTQYVEELGAVRQEFPLGSNFSYNNAAFSLAGRVIEKVTGQTFESALQERILDPLGLVDTAFPPAAVLPRRFSAGHFILDDRTEVARRWLLPRSLNAAGTLCSTPRDMLTWAEAHIGRTGHPRRGVLTSKLVREMRRPTRRHGLNALGDGVGTSWLLTDLGGTQMVGHGGGTNGQVSLFQTVPAEGFAITCLANGSSGRRLNQLVLDWALQSCLGRRLPRRQPLRPGQEARSPYLGDYENQGGSVILTPSEDGRIRLTGSVSDFGRVASLAFAGDQWELAQSPPFDIELLEGGQFRTYNADRFTAGSFERGPDGSVVAVNLGGRRFARSVAAGPK